jgi:hypothetical protein
MSERYCRPWPTPLWDDADVDARKQFAQYMQDAEVARDLICQLRAAGAPAEDIERARKLRQRYWGLVRNMLESWRPIERNDDG